MENKSLNQTIKKLDAYISLLNLSYEQAVEKLLLKYGAARHDYYKEKSYTRFLNGEIKNITRGDYKRTQEGLYCHHIDEFEFENLSNKDFIQSYKYPFYRQKKDRLVYCDLIEHLILHTLIIKETDGERGFTGYITFLRPMVNEWYIDKKNPKPEWMKICKEKSYLQTDQIKILLTHIDVVIDKVSKKQHMKTIGYRDLNRRLNLNMTIEQYKEYKKIKQKMKKELESKIIELEIKKSRVKEKENTEIMIQQFNIQFPKLKNLKIIPSTSRREILDYLFEYKYKESFSSKKEFYSFKINVLKDDLFKELNSILNNKH